MTTIENALAEVHWRGIELVHGRHEDGFGVLLAGILLVGALLWVVSRTDKGSV
jgi:hypothetical protein